MKKGCLIGGGILGVLIILALVVGGWFMGIYNSMVTKGEDVTKSWANVENTYQKRSDLVPNLVNTVKGAADFEKSTLTDVIEARAKATSTTIDPSNLTAEKIQEFQSAQSGLSGALSRLLVSIERYPELKSNQNFLALQTELSSIENEIVFERQKFNESAQQYNTYIKTAPQTFLAGMFNFDEKAYFQSEQGAEKAPEVEF